MKLKTAVLSWAAICLFVAGMAIVPHDAQAQVLYGSIVGNVKDASGGAVPQAAVTITNKETNQSREGTTDSTGDFTFLDVQTGTYSVKASKTGFKTYERTTVVVSLNTTTRLDATLEVGAMTESVTVTAEAAALQTDTSEVHVDVSTTELANLPVPLGRNYQQIYRALPGFAPPSNAHSIPTNPSRSLYFNVNGATASQNNTRIDGVSTYNIQLPHVTSYVPTLDSIQEVNVVTNSFDAEQGFAGGAAINVQSKSGGNMMHGSLFEYNSNNHIKAWPMRFDRVSDPTVNAGNKPKTIYNQFGGSVGGPIIKDKLFYFVSYEGTRDHRAVQNYTTVPTPEAIAGDLSALAAEAGSDIYDPMTGDQATGAGRSQFISYPTGPLANAACADAVNGCLNMIPTSRLDPSVQQILALVPTINVAGSENSEENYFASAPFIYDRNQVDTKINYNPTSKLNLIGTYGYLRFKDITPTLFGDALGGEPIGGTSNPGRGSGSTYRFTIMGTYTFTPNLVMDAHFGYSKANANSEQPGLGTNIGTDVLGIPGTNGSRPFEGGWPEFDLGGFAIMGVANNFMPYYRHDPQSQYVANFNWIKAKHNVRFGMDFYRMALNHTQAEFLAGGVYGAQGGFNFSEGFTSGGGDVSRANSLASFLLGLPDIASRTFQVPEVMELRAHLISGYARDRWSVTPKLTLDYGVRWEYIPVPTRADRGIERYDPVNNTMLVCGVGSVPKGCGISVSKKLFAPRLGFAYRASNTFVVRAGYGITWDAYMGLEPLRGNFPTMVALVHSTSGVVPFRRLSDATPSFSSGPGALPVGIDSIPTPDVGDGILDMTNLPEYAYAGYPQNMRRGYVQSWNFTLQKELGWGFIGQAGYVATRSIRAVGFLDINAGQEPGLEDAGRPLYAAFGRTANTIMITPLGTGHYDSLQAQLQRRFSQGLSMAVNYTWSKAINYTGASDGTPQIQSLRYMSLSRAPADFDRTHNLQIMSQWQLPFGKGKRWVSGGGVGSAILGGWQTNSLISVMSGAPFTVYASGTYFGMPGSNQTADQVKPNVTRLGGTGRGNPFYDPTAFADITSPPARLGTSGFDSLRGPGLVNWDFGVTREFSITERWKLQFRMESFNFTNTPHMANPNDDVTSSDFMTIRSVTNLAREGIDERQFRFGLRLQF